MENEILPEDAILIFPEVSGKNLNGKEFQLPGDLEGKVNLVIIAFERWQQQLVDTWLSPADSLASRVPGLVVYELPTLRRMNAVNRWFIDQGMRSGIPDEIARHRTITLYINKAPFREVLEIKSEETIHLFLLDDEGRVRWRARGGAERAQVKSLERAAKSIVADRSMKPEGQDHDEG